MFILYNCIQFALLPVLGPILLGVSFLRKKYRHRFLKRLGLGIHSQVRSLRSSQQRRGPTIWVHALSVGETTSSLPLLRGLRETYPDSFILFTTTTSSGEKLARKIIQPQVDLLLPAPIDLLFTVHHFINTIQPDLFIQIETDFWPNWLFTLHKKGVPSLLVNGRVSAKSAQRYQAFPWFFSPLFSSFSVLCMQTEADAAKMQGLGIEDKKLQTLGNLKADMVHSEQLGSLESCQSIKQRLQLPEDQLIWICGSTHRGEEQLLLDQFTLLHPNYPCTMVIAPRDIDRAEELLSMCKDAQLSGVKRSDLPKASHFDILILDTIGELATLYQVADIVFVGGSMVPCGGHNPLEPAQYGKPILYGPHMEDFSEIAEALLIHQGAIQVHNKEELAASLSQLFQEDALRVSMGNNAANWMVNNQGVVQRVLAQIAPFLPPTG